MERKKGKGGLRGYIRSRMPEPWYHVLKQEKKVNRFIEYVYQSQPDAHRGIKGYKKGIYNIRLGFERCPIYEMFNAKLTSEGLIYWVGIHNKIKDYINNNR